VTNKLIAEAQAKSMTKQNVHIFADLDALSQGMAHEIAKQAQAAIAERGIFTMVLAGGSTPRKLYELLAKEFQTQIDWTKVHFFWGDERCVPPTDSDSNFAMAWQALLSKVPAPKKNVHRMPADLATPEQAALAYEKELRDFFELFSVKSFPIFDLILLGLGEDGHTASLFPDSPALEEKTRWVVPVIAPANYKVRPRITLTLPVINQAEHVFFLASGKEKKKVIESIFKTSDLAQTLFPAALILPQGQLAWFLDHSTTEGIDSFSLF